MRIAIFVLCLIAVIGWVFCNIRIIQLEKKRDKLLLQIIDDTLSLCRNCQKSGMKKPSDSIVEAAQTAINGSFEEGREM